MDKSALSTSQPANVLGSERPLMDRLSSEDFQKFLTGGEVQSFDQGTLVIAEGAQETSLHILLEGEVDVLVPTPKGWLRVAMLGRGSVIGEMAFLDDLPRSARVVAREPCSALKITRESFQQFATREPIIALALVWELSRTVTTRMRRVERFDAAEVAREEERKTLAAELHDETMADMGSMAVELGFMKRMAAGESAELQEGLDELRVRLKSTDKRLREIVQGIYPPALALRGLASALNSYLGELSIRPITSPYPLEIELRATGFDKERLPEDVETGVYRVVQQALNNTIQHAQAKQLLIDLRWSDSELSFSLVDDGVGFDVDNPKENPTTGHFGLANLRDRTERLMGRLEIESQSSVGTTVRGRVPVVNEAPRPKETQTSIYVFDNRQPVEDEQEGI